MNQQRSLVITWHQSHIHTTHQRPTAKYPVWTYMQTPIHSISAWVSPVAYTRDYIPGQSGLEPKNTRVLAQFMRVMDKLPHGRTWSPQLLRTKHLTNSSPISYWIHEGQNTSSTWQKALTKAFGYHARWPGPKGEPKVTLSTKITICKIEPRWTAHLAQFKTDSKATVIKIIQG